MSGYQYEYNAEIADRMEALLKTTKDCTSWRKIQCVYLRSKFGYLPKEIAQITGLSISRVRQIHTLYNQKGEAGLKGIKRGGRNHSYMDKESEEKILASFKERAAEGQIITTKEIQKKYEEVARRKVAKSAIYKLLHRHKWRKIFPRPHHPNQNKEAIESFKKTLPHWLPPRVKNLN